MQAAQAPRRALHAARCLLNQGAAKTVTITIDGQEAQVRPGQSIISACEENGVDIPRFCYHERLSVAGNCRMCLVEVEKSPKPMASCAVPVMPGMKVWTDTPMVKKAREGVMEYLLSNHPLDCPICDQGGECDLQDQSMVYGSDRSRFHEIKRTVEDKNVGPLVKMIMTRCIHCTRCVRFASEVAGVGEFGVTGRGNSMEIGTYIERLLDSEMSANVVDLCPVGALTAKPNMFANRPWELRSTESVDVMDGLGSAIVVDCRGTEVMRVGPRLNEDINEEWISDKTRFAYDGLKRQRLVSPMARRGDSFKPVTWEQALSYTSDVLQDTAGEDVVAVVGKFADGESIMALKDLMVRLEAGTMIHETFAGSNADVQTGYRMNSTIAGIEEADCLLIVGSNPRVEAPVLNARIRKCVVHNGLKVGMVGSLAPLNFDVEHLGTTPEVLTAIANGTHPFCKALAGAKRPVILVGEGAAQRADGEGILAVAQQIAQSSGAMTADWNGFGVLHSTASAGAAYDMGFAPASAATPASKPAKVLYLLGADEFPAHLVGPDTFVIYQGHQGDRGATAADVILPGVAYTEKYGIYVNTEGRSQEGSPAAVSPGEARDDWKIIAALAEVATGESLGYSDLDGVRDRMADVSPGALEVDSIQASSSMTGAAPTFGAYQLYNTPIEAIASDFYLADPISRASSTMAKCKSNVTRGLDGRSSPMPSYRNFSVAGLEKGVGPHVPVQVVHA